MIQPSVKFHKYIPYGLGVMNRTGMHGRTGVKLNALTLMHGRTGVKLYALPPFCELRVHKKANLTITPLWIDLADDKLMIFFLIFQKIGFEISSNCKLSQALRRQFK